MAITEPVKNCAADKKSFDAFQKLKAFRVEENAQTVHDAGLGTFPPVTT